MSNYKLIASDLDGTLLRGDMTVSGKDKAAIKELADRGITFTVNSGRTLYRIPEEVRENPSIRYIAYSNGAAVYDKELSRDIISNRVPKESVKNVFDIISEYEVMISVHVDGRAYLDESMQNESSFSHYRINDYYKILLSNANTIDRIREFCINSDGVESIIMFFHSDDALEECRAKLEAVEGLTVTSSVEHNLEICSDKAGKGEALAALAEILGISGEDIISVGDNMNDTSMFSVSGLALCVASGNKEAKDFADEIICTNEENPIDYILSSYIIVPPADEKPKIKKKTLAAIIAAVSAAVALFFAIIAISLSNSALKIGYAGIKNNSSWSGTYAKLDGEMSHSITPKNDGIRISVTTESGDISIEVKDNKGNIIFDEENIGTREFTIDTDGKIYIKIEADDHKGKFIIG